MSWKSELRLQLEKRGEAEEMCSQESPLTDGSAKVSVDICGKAQNRARSQSLRWGEDLEESLMVAT